MAISTNQFKNGNHIEVDGTVYKILEFQHVKPGKGGAFVRTKLRRASDGNVIDRTFRAGEKFRPVRTESKKMQFLYADGSDAHFMDTESFEQIAIGEASIKDELRWLTPSSEVDGTVYKILEFQHVKPGKGGAFVRTKLRRASDGNVIDRTFRAGEKFRPVRTESKKMQFLYADGSDAHFMDTESFEQIAIVESSIADELRWMTPSSEVDMLLVDGEPSDVQLPSAVDLEVSQTDPGVRGDTASGGGTKPATLETGAVINVPLFVEPGQRIRVDTRSGEYVARA